MTLRKLIRHAELYGVDEVWEAASGLTDDERNTLARRLAHIDPKWRIPGNLRTSESGISNPHSNAEKCHATRDPDKKPLPPSKRDKWGVCGECRQTFKASRSTARYCSATCRKRAHRRTA
jgi:hypothetical protein